MSDIHLVSGRKTIIGLDPIEKLKKALKHAIETQKDISQIVFTGDLAHDGTLEEYLILKEILQNVKVPITFMMGNHDNRKAFCLAFPSIQLDSCGFLQTALTYENHTLLFLDTLEVSNIPEHKHNGFLCEKRLSWLERELVKAGKRKVILFMHHPAFSVGFKAMDKTQLGNSEQFFSLLDRYNSVIHIICGHIHRTISGNCNGYGFSMFKSTCHQMPMMFESENVKLSTNEPPAYGILCLVDNGVVVHSDDYELSMQEKKVFDKYT